MATQTEDPKTFWGYLYDDKTPTKRLDSLLKAIAQYIVRFRFRAFDFRILYISHQVYFED
jgi:hypothetical protein